MIKAKSFTLIEVIIVLSLVGIMSLVLAPYISTLLDSWTFGKSDRDLLSGSRLAMNRMVREIRQVKDSDSITTFSATRFNFTDINDNVIDFQQSSTFLLRNADTLTNKLQDPGGLTFSYLDSSGAVTAVKNNIRMVKIQLILSSMGNSITTESLSRFRNITD